MSWKQIKMTEKNTRRVILKGISQHGKNRVREHGSDWEVIELHDKVPALGDVRGAFLKAPDGDLRWVRLHDDPHFEMTGLDPDFLTSE